MPAVKSAVMAVLVASAVVAVALPSPQAATDASDIEPLHLEVQCGCWNLCTLEALGDASITGCDSSCDPQFLCETIDAQTSGPTTIVAATASASASAISKRSGSLGGTPPPFNPFGPGGEFDEETQLAAKAVKRALDIRPTPGPTVLEEPPFPGSPFKVKRAPERPLNPRPACPPGQTDCPDLIPGFKRRDASPGPLINPIIDPCPKGVVCENIAKRDPDPRPPIVPLPCPFGPDCPPPVGDVGKRAAEPRTPIHPDDACPPGSTACDPIPVGVSFPEKRAPGPQTPEFPDLDDTGRYPKHKIPRTAIVSDDSGFEKRRIPWDLTIKGSCSGGGCSGEVSVTIHF